MPNIQFFDTTREISEHFHPRPSKFHIPEWLTKLAPYIDDEKKYSTAKRCLPIIDAVMFGYTLVLTEDVRVTNMGPGVPTQYEWHQSHGIEWHPLGQVSTHPEATEANYYDKIPKWVSPWTIRTPDGYSCLFVSPLNKEDSVIVPFSGVVDTDTYNLPVGFPFMLKDPKFSGVIEAGTPVVQVIPFKREPWTHEVLDMSEAEDRKAYRFVKSQFKNVYRKYFRQDKSFV